MVSESLVGSRYYVAILFTVTIHTFTRVVVYLCSYCQRILDLFWCAVKIYNTTHVYGVIHSDIGQAGSVVVC